MSKIIIFQLLSFCLVVSTIQAQSISRLEKKIAKINEKIYKQDLAIKSLIMTKPDKMSIYESNLEAEINHLKDTKNTKLNDYDNKLDKEIIKIHESKREEEIKLLELKKELRMKKIAEGYPDSLIKEKPDTTQQKKEEKQKNVDVLLKYKELYEAGLLTKEEFNRKKYELMGWKNLAYERGKIKQLNISFSAGKATLLPGFETELDTLVDILNQYEFLKIQVTGHTDNVGSESINKRLSEKRAEAVASYLIESGIDPDRIIFIGWGSAKPIADNNTEEGRNKNRRVEYVLYE